MNVAHQQNRAHLYYPTRTHSWGAGQADASPYEPHNHPLGIQDRGYTFPFPVPLGLSQIGLFFDVRQYRYLGAVSPVRAIRGTGTDSKTTVAKTLRNLPEHYRLETFRLSDLLWDRFMRYALGPGQDVVMPDNHVQQYGNMPDFEAEVLGNHGVWSAWTGHGSLPLASAAQQSGAINSLHKWAECYITRLPLGTIANCEPAVQDDFHDQFIIPINLLLKTRFRAENQAQYPVIGRACTADSIWSDPDGYKLAAGLPDFLSQLTANPNRNGALFEIKTWWSYPTNYYHRLFTEMAARNGDFGWQEGSPNEVSIEKQLWGEVLKYGCTFGAWTNGQIVGLFVRTGVHELTFSHTRDWNDPLIRLALTGLSFAAMNASNLGDIDDPDALIHGLIENLCPENSRRVPAEQEFGGNN